VLGHCLHSMVQAFVQKEEQALSDGSLQVGGWGGGGWGGEVA